MKIHEFLQELQKYSDDQNSLAVFTYNIFDNIVEENNPFENASDNLLRQVFNGTKPLAKKKARALITNLDIDKLANYLHEKSTYHSRIQMAEGFKEYIGNVSERDVTMSVANLFVEIIKKCISNANNANEIIAASPANIFDELARVVKKLNQLTPIKTETLLKYTAPSVDKKIKTENFLLCKSISEDVVDYYEYIENLFKNDSDSAHLFDDLARYIKKISDEKISTCSNQNQVFEEMTLWIKATTNSNSIIACQILASFFVQNCDIFSPITL